ncbi:unnamed protein product [Arabidopsis arenosa]|uniref:Leucine-rich repeat-containing N-terminal plant-type domain-containing protein n=1 Tax=Arabidopsis arenosa TaxID=38785 RepID=A0A8S2AXC9_ARAAE|nr:unnamed protein product [Arabidopsis arenosa]
MIDANQANVDCLRTFKSQVEDPNGYLWSWNSGNQTEAGFICKFSGVTCWHDDENRVLSIKLSGYGLRGVFPLGIKQCIDLSGLDLSRNNFSGPLPSNLTDVIPLVTTLDLSFNSFTGGIPVNIANITFLNSLMLQNNQFTGQLPPELVKLGRLKTFSVANNRLSGPIPTFNSTSINSENFANNSGLCGKPLDECKSASRGRRRWGMELEQLKKSVEENPDDSSLQFELGLYLWNNGGDSEKAAEHFVLSAKSDPNNAVAFKYLGHYYSRVTLDLNRAAKCYQRAVLINPNDSDSGEALLGYIQVLFNWPSLFLQSVFIVLLWLIYGYGFYHSFIRRSGLKLFKAFNMQLEALGLAYQRLGMFTAAIKAYGRAIELDETKFFALMESANIFLMLGSYRKGVELFEQALKISPQNISGLYGLASGLLSWSKECINLGAFGWAASLLEAYDVLGLYYGLGRTFFNPASAKVFSRFNELKEATKNYTISATPEDRSSVLQQGGTFVEKTKALEIIHLSMMSSMSAAKPLLLETYWIKVFA